MIRPLAAALTLALAFTQETPGLGIAAGSKFRYRQHGEAVVAWRALGVEQDGTALHLIIDADLGWTVAKANGRSLECDVAPRSYRIEFKDKGQVLELKDGKFTNSLQENQGPGLTKPFSLAMADTGKVEKVTTADGEPMMMAKFLLDVLPSDTTTLLGWFGPLPSDLKTAEWTTTKKVLLARSDFLTITATCDWKKEERVIRGKFKAAGRGWPSDADEVGEGTVKFDDKGRVLSSTVTWSAKTKVGALLASYKSQVDLSE
jgi:hypothetical protein